MSEAKVELRDVVCDATASKAEVEGRDLEIDFLDPIAAKPTRASSYRLHQDARKEQPKL